MTVRMLLHPSTLTAFAGALSFLAALTTVTVILITHGTDDVFAQQQSMNGNLDLHSDNGAPRGIWSDRSTIWVADLADRKLYAYALASGARQDTKDIDLSTVNVKPYGIWSDGTTIWALNTRDDKIYAFSLTDGSRDENKELRLDSSNDVPAGIWSDGATMWVVNQIDKKLYAYALDGGARQSDKDIVLSFDRPRPLGIWSDNTTVWIAYDYHQDYVDDDDFKLYAFTLEGGARQSDKDVAISIDLFSRSSDVWSNGTTMWLADSFHDKLIAYELPQRATSSDGTLSAMGLNAGTLSPTFATSTTSYTASVEYEITGTTLNATTSHDSAVVAILDSSDSYLADADENTPGHQIHLNVGENTFKLKVTAEDDTTVKIYTITIIRAKPEVSVRAGVAEVIEGSDALFAVSREKAVFETLDVVVSITESETLVPDSEEGGRTVTIPPGATSTMLTVTTETDDNTWEDHSTVTATIADNNAYAINTNSGSAETNVNDNDFPDASAALSVLPNPVAEGETVTTTITVITNADHRPHGSGGVLELTSDNGIAQLADYGSLSQTLFPIAATDFSAANVSGATRYKAEYSATITTQDDSEVEVGENFSVAMSMSGGSPANISLSQQSTVTVNITDNDSALGQLDLSGITLSPEFSSDTYSYTARVEYTVTETTVAATTTHEESSLPTIKGNGIMASDGTVPLLVGDNEITVEVTAEDATTFRTYTIVVTRAKTSVSISTVAAEVSEGQNVVFTVTRDTVVPEPLDVPVSVTETEELVPDANEGAKVVTIPTSAKSMTLIVFTDVDDDAWKAHSTVAATISENDAYLIVTGAGSASAKVNDNDFPAASASLSVSPNPAAEGGTVTATVTVTTDADQQPHGGAGTLSISAHDGTAQAADYGRFGQTFFQIGPADFTPLTFNGATRYRAHYTAAIVITDDSDTEVDEMFDITIAKSNAPQITLSSPATTSVTIRANDSSTDPTLSVLSLSAGTLAPAFTSGTTSYTSNVGNAVEQITVNAKKNADDSTVSFLDSSDSDLADADDGTPGHQVNLNVGENIIKVKVTAEDDTTMKVYTIIVSRTKPVVSIRAETSEAVEGSDLIFTLSRQASVPDRLGVRVNVDEDGALIFDIEEGNRTVAIPIGATSTAFTVTTDSDDEVWEAHSTAKVTIANDDAYTVNPGEGRAETLLKDDDFPSGDATLSVDPVSVAEGGIVTTTITVTTDGDQRPHGGGGTLILSLVGGTAGDTDYGSLSQTTFPISKDDFSHSDVGGGAFRYQGTYTATLVISDDSESESTEDILFQLMKGADATQIVLGTSTTATVMIAANDAGTDADLSALSLSEGTLSPDFATSTASYAALVPYGVECISVMTTKSDQGAEVEFLDGSGSIIADADDTAGHQVKLTVGENAIKVKVTAEDGITTKFYTITIARAKPQVRISSSPVDVSESAEVVFTVSRNAAVSDILEVMVDVEETNMLTSDANEGTVIITIPAQATSTTLAVATDTDDDMWEEHSILTASISPGAAYDIEVGQGSAQVHIEDDDFPTATAVLTVSPDPVVEGGTLTATLTITTTADEYPHGGGGTLVLSTSGVTAQTTDYGSLSQSSFVVAAADFSSVTVNVAVHYQAVYTATITIAEDSDAEVDETFEITVGKNSDASQISLTAGDTALVTISASDLSVDATLTSLVLSEETLSPSFASNTTSYAASVGYGVEKVTLTPTLSDSNASVSIDMTTVATGSSHQVDLAVGTNSIQVVVTAQDDRTLTTYTITVTRAKAEVSISPKSSELFEGTEVVFAVNRNAAVSDALDVIVDVTESGTLVADPEQGRRTVTIASGATTTALTVSTDVDDDVWEEHSTVSAAVASIEGYTVRIGESSADVQVMDNDFPEATAALSVIPNPVAEGETLTVSVAIATNAEQQPHGGGGALVLSVDGGTAQPVDYESLSQNSFLISDTDFTFNTGEDRYRSAYTATILITDDSEVEVGENFMISMSKSVDAPSSLTLAEPAAVGINIIDNNVGLSSLSLSGANLSPTFSSEIVSYTAIAPYSVSETMVSATTAHASSSAPVVRLNGVEKHNVALPLVVGENLITVEVTAENSNTSRTYTVMVTRQKPEVSVGADVTVATEGEILSFTVTRSSAPPEPLAVIVSVTEDGTLVHDGSGGEGIRSVVIPAGATSTDLTVITEMDDYSWESHSTVTVAISGSDSYTIRTGEGAAETVVEDNDFPEATAVLTVVPDSVVEGGTVIAEVTVTTARDEMPHAHGGHLFISTANDTAIGGVDYTALTTQEGTINLDKSDFTLLNGNGPARHRASKQVNIDTTLDSDREGAEKFIVILAKVATGTSPAASQIALDSANHILRVTIHDGPEAELSVLALNAGSLMPPFATSTTTYEANVDYTVEQITITAIPGRNNTQVTFLDGSDNEVSDADDSVPGQQVDLVEGENVIRVRVSAQDNTVLQTYTVTVNRAKPEVSISAIATDVTEGNEVVFEVTRSAAVTEPLRVVVSVTESDTMVSDPLEGEGTRSVAIPGNATSTTLTVVSDVNDDTWEAHSTVRATIKSDDTYDIKADGDSDATRVMDNDFPEANVQLAVSPSEVTEGKSVAAFVTVTTLRDEEPHADAGTFQVLVTGVTATSGSDFIPPVVDRITFALNDFNETLAANGEARYWASEQVSIATVNDDEQEGPETFSVELARMVVGNTSTTSRIAIDPNARLRLITINDDDQDQMQNGGSDQDGSTSSDSTQNPTTSERDRGTGGGGGSARSSSNRKPKFTEGSDTTRSVAENSEMGTKVGERVSATDRDGDRLTYSLGGEDRDSFTINKTSSRLYTNVDLDRETTARYYVTVSVSDRAGAGDSIEVIIIVTDVDEGPAVTGETVISHMEEVTGVLATYNANDPENGAISWTLSGEDAGAFSIDDGALTSRAPPDFETPADANGDNIYLVSIAASDGVHTSNLDVAVTVTDLDESPTPTSTPRPTPTSTPAPSATLRAAPTATPPVLQNSAPTPTLTPTSVPTPTLKVTPTATPTTTPTLTPTPVHTLTPTPAPVPSPTYTPTETPTPVPSVTLTPSPTSTPAQLATPIPTLTPAVVRGITLVSPTPVATPAPLIASADSGSVPAWLMLSITVWAILATGGGVFVYLRHR